MRLLFAGLLLGGLIATSVANPRDFVVSAKPVFESSSYWPTSPISVEIENKGPDAAGQLLLTDNYQSVRYPIELPTGAKKRIIAYPVGSAYGTVPELLLDTDQARFPIPYASKGTYAYGEVSVVALISDNSGELGFLKQVERGKNNQTGMYADAYCPPEDAPERPVGYQGLSTIVLGEGADRLSDASIKAIQTFTLTGGTVVFVGGASAQVLNDGRWKSFIPATEFRTINVTGSRVLTKIGERPVTESLTVSAGVPVSSAKVQRDGSVPMIIESGYGIGKVVVFAFNPFEDPLLRWEGRRRLFALYGRALDNQRATTFLTQFDSTQSQGMEYGYGSSPYSASYPSSNTGNDPFSVELPAASKVFWILAAFFVTVVPINFIVLKKLGKGEWAWATAPVISIIFAGIFLNQASDLYAAGLSTATKGALVVQQDGAEAIFVGSTQMFFPNGGSYDLNLQNVDQLGSGRQYDYYGGGQSRSQVTPVDIGSIRVPDLRAANLAFEQIGYRQRFSGLTPLHVQSKLLGNSKIQVKISNRSSDQIRNGALIVAGRRYGIDLLEAGQDKVMEVNTEANPQAAQGDFLDALTVRNSIAVVVSDITGLKAGPQIGSAVSAQSGVRMIYVAPLPIAGVKA